MDGRREWRSSWSATRQLGGGGDVPSLSLLFFGDGGRPDSWSGRVADNNRLQDSHGHTGRLPAKSDQDVGHLGSFLWHDFCNKENILTNNIYRTSVKAIKNTSIPWKSVHLWDDLYTERILWVGSLLERLSNKLQTSRSSKLSIGRGHCLSFPIQRILGPPESVKKEPPTLGLYKNLKNFPLKFL